MTARTGGPIKHFVTTIMASSFTESVIGAASNLLRPELTPGTGKLSAV